MPSLQSFRTEHTGTTCYDDRQHNMQRHEARALHGPRLCARPSVTEWQLPIRRNSEQTLSLLNRDHARQACLRNQHALVLRSLAHLLQKPFEFVFGGHPRADHHRHRFGERVLPQPLLRAAQIGWLLKVYLDRKPTSAAAAGNRTPKS